MCKDHWYQRHKTVTLAPTEFIGRLLLHVPELGLQTIRYYGLFGSVARDRRNECRAHLNDGFGKEMKNNNRSSGMAELICKACSLSMKIRFKRYICRGVKGNSYKQVSVPRIFQPVDETVHANKPKHPEWCYEYG
jgi:hypothetical protein